MLRRITPYVVASEQGRKDFTHKWLNLGMQFIRKMKLTRALLG